MQLIKILIIDGDAEPRAGKGLAWGRPANAGAGVPTALPTTVCPGRDSRPSLGPRAPWDNSNEAATGNAFHPLQPPHWGLSLHQGPSHILGSILAGLLRGQLSNQQGLQELAHKIEVLVEGVEGILKESRQSGGQTDGWSSTQRQQAETKWKGC